MKCFEVVGYIKDGECFCVDHKPRGLEGVVLAGTEGAETLYCVECLEDWRRGGGKGRAPAWVFLIEFAGPGSMRLDDDPPQKDPSFLQR